MEAYNLGGAGARQIDWSVFFSQVSSQFGSSGLSASLIAKYFWICGTKTERRKHLQSLFIRWAPLDQVESSWQLCETTSPEAAKVTMGARIIQMQSGFAMLEQLGCLGLPCFCLVYDVLRRAWMPFFDVFCVVCSLFFDASCLSLVLHFQFPVRSVCFTILANAPEFKRVHMFAIETHAGYLSQYSQEPVKHWIFTVS